MKYCVNLINGDVTMHEDVESVKNPNKVFNNEHQAGYLALTICLKNLKEKSARLGVDDALLDIDFLMLGTTYTITKEQAIIGMESLKNDYTEYFI